MLGRVCFEFYLKMMNKNPKQCESIIRANGFTEALMINFKYSAEIQKECNFRYYKINHREKLNLLHPQGPILTIQ